MGGDDLGSEDEYLDQSWGKSKEPVADVEEVDEEGIETHEQSEGNSRKRKINDQNAKKKTSLDNLNESETKEHDDVKLRKKVKKGSMQALMLETSRNIADEDCEVQATFLWTTFTHALKMSGDDIESVEKFNSTNFSPTTKALVKNGKSMPVYFKSGVLSSNKRLKKWKEPQSPMVLILCASARRSVAILKDLSSLNLRIGKLFPKNMKLDEQITMLKQSSFGIAVGTPNRILKLSQAPVDGSDDTGVDNEDCALSLEKTELVVIDCHQDQKRFTICTLNDTALDLMKFIRHAVVPQMQKRKDIKIAMF
uniref:Uncharacterized protein n=1 Tax=Eucampia antarctica TaxID=49252 RepID=A0A7S2WNL1_9STRA|mmetsp:Transcript_6771/g.6349  ORF Transcript_6771/g.6349 Transcript_6771/m.6349 type:complete len:309 (+) Transcript_6771:74-1000(+)|eukprot:CAMPEP_0197832408 /NCGR_PEP_ID=MMETSP1437-20131217/14628_1 /TAXON_ID=49252 ORGANISM="Eucampia antarctica, Strain CCMP1452" /NCGR_SAMPLE_ID=MMETSP1437 /ASSEMBLY_ACC=CAM_ASM_001096 /LENGTH=308 /DNA_ID=CAMNT_0043435779 /DNA_START=24 /DNA_END=950 /DNA_ORIENTATION=-